jgi:hypothetical protein
MYFVIQLLVPFAITEIDYMDILIRITNTISIERPNIILKIYTVLNFQEIQQNTEVAIIAHGNYPEQKYYSKQREASFCPKSVVKAALQKRNITIWHDFSCGTPIGDSGT